MNYSCVHIHTFICTFRNNRIKKSNIYKRSGQRQGQEAQRAYLRMDRFLCLTEHGHQVCVLPQFLQK